MGMLLQHSKTGRRLAAQGQTRSFGDVGLMSGLPENGRLADIGRLSKGAIPMFAPFIRLGSRDYSALMPASLMIGHHFTISAFW
jgi:hypothetical protein